MGPLPVIIIKPSFPSFALKIALGREKKECHVVSGLGVEADPSKTDKIKYWPTPSTSDFQIDVSISKRSSKFPPTLLGNGEMRRSLHHLPYWPI